jgi:polar amino acid transport system substrate-binding protein
VPGSIAGHSHPKGAFAFKKGNHELLDPFNRQLRISLGSDDHRRRMKRFGMTGNEIDPVVLVECRRDRPFKPTVQLF